MQCLRRRKIGQRKSGRGAENKLREVQKEKIVPVKMCDKIPADYESLEEKAETQNNMALVVEAISKEIVVGS